jgi:peptide deformylase
MILPIVLYPDPRLKQKSHPVVKHDEELKSLFADMVETMRHYSGLGLAAIQVGKPLNFMVMDPEYDKENKGEGLALINPVIVEYSGVQKDEEGCLSLPDIRVELERPYKVTLKALDINGQEVQYTFEGLLARCIFHEMDHMKGQLFIEKISSIKRLFIKSQLKELQKEYESAKRAKV